MEALAAMKARVRKWGNSAAVRLPASIIQAADVRLDDSVEIREERGRIVIEPIRPSQYDLAALLNAITPENLHDEADFGGPVGRETW
jgi:antitoxin MazE